MLTSQPLYKKQSKEKLVSFIKEGKLICFHYLKALLKDSNFNIIIGDAVDCKFTSILNFLKDEIKDIEIYNENEGVKFDISLLQVNKPTLLVSEGITSIQLIENFCINHKIDKPILLENIDFVCLIAVDKILITPINEILKYYDIFKALMEN